MFLGALTISFAVMASTLFATPAIAQVNTAVPVATNARYELLERWDVDRLNRILQSDTQKFSGVPIKYTPARNAVLLYRITYSSMIPESGNKPTIASGLLAIPDVADKSFPMVSYQHGTVYGRQEVPSFPDKSPETQLMIAQFAGQGYLLIGADYFGMGTSTEAEGYMVKGSHQQATYDMLIASQDVLHRMGFASTRLFLSGWSQGGFVTMAFLEKLESFAVKVQGVVTASAPLDIFALMEGFFVYPRKIDAPWINSVVLLAAFSFENYYKVPGLAKSLIATEYYDVSKKFYDREPINASDVPADLHKFIKPEYFDSQYFANSAFGKLAAATQAYRWLIKSPVQNYYGESDEAITPGIARMAVNYAQAMGAGNPLVEAISTGPTTHRGTFATAVPLWKIWFDGKK